MIPARPRRPRPGFTLVEMIVVMAIIVVLIALIGPALGTMVRGPLVTQASDRVVGLLNLAQQASTARNLPVEVRFYQYADGSVAGESVNNAGSGKYRAMQLFLANENGTVTPLNAVEAFPTGIIADPGTADLNTTLTTLLNTFTPPTQLKQWTPTDPQLPLPRANVYYNCCAFRFRPDGSTDLSPTGPPGSANSTTKAGWFITLYNINDFQSGRAAPPANYVTVQIDPVNGASTVYRP